MLFAPKYYTGISRPLFLSACLPLAPSLLLKPLPPDQVKIVNLDKSGQNFNLDKFGQKHQSGQS